MHIHPFFDANTATYSYIVVDNITNHCAIIDPVLDFELSSKQMATTSADKLIAFVKHHQLKVSWLLETHIHADHLTAAWYLKNHLGGKIAIGEHIKTVLKHWLPALNMSDKNLLEGTQFDHLFQDNECFSIGSLSARVMHTPGHTPACVTYIIDDAAFVGDTLFMPYVGTARTDFPGGSAAQLYQSIQKILALPENTHLYTCHDYPPSGESPQCVSSIVEQKHHNIMIKQSISQEDYIATRCAKDYNKPAPKLLMPALHVNVQAGFIEETENIPA
jgi:glyoxylase-like metal-dependent hydrolase (beta-lactamase superfamily II)